MEKLKHSSVSELIENTLKNNFIGGQEELRHELAKNGYDVTQSTISRALKKIGAVRTYNEKHQPTYVIPNDDSLPPVNATIMDLVQDIVANENLIVVSTKPGSASLIARHIDFNAETCIGTIAGDDCFLAIPKSIKKIKKTKEEIQSLLGWKS